MIDRFPKILFDAKKNIGEQVKKIYFKIPKLPISGIKRETMILKTNIKYTRI